VAGSKHTRKRAGAGALSHPASAAIRFFESPSQFRSWLVRYHSTVSEQWVGFHKRDSGKASITWPESVDEALCFGWIDGIRRSVDAVSYVIRFTPRKTGSIWSAVNVARANALIKARRMRSAGRKAFEVRKDYKSGIYAYEQRGVELPEPYDGILRGNPEASRFFHAQAPGYRKRMMWWVVSAKREETRLRRLATLVEDCAAGRTFAPMTRRPAPSP
jgi:uncharacterized protein YdeI (YjbR/CyaY-like superfamily)